MNKIRPSILLAALSLFLLLFAAHLFVRGQCVRDDDQAAAETGVVFPNSGPSRPGPDKEAEAAVKPSFDAACVEAVAGLRSSNNGQLRKLARHQEICSCAFGQMMVFDVFPSSETSARPDAREMADTLKEFARHNIKPIVIIEPFMDADGNYMSFREAADGGYQEAWETYFAALKEQGIDDGAMGLWVPFPEPNTDSWGRVNANPGDFAAAFNAYGKTFKQFFPQAALSVLLDNETYQWANDDTEAASLAPYVGGLDKECVDSLGLQGFPWPAPAAAANYDAGYFLNAGRAIETAHALGVRSVWFNTGTFSSSNIVPGAKALDADQRKKILNTILGQLIAAKTAGFSVGVNIFAQNKISQAEGIDWSYQPAAGQAAGADAAALADFVSQAARQGIGLSIFDE